MGKEPNPGGATASKRPRPSKATRWRAAVLIGVHLLAAIHIAHWLSEGRTLSPLEPSEAKAFAESSVINAGLIFFGLTIASTLLLGRWFCGWACHLVALQDLSRALLIRVGLRPRPLRSRWMGLVPLLAAVYMFLWPFLFRLWDGQALGTPTTHFVSERDEFWSTFTTSWLMAGGTFLVCGFVVVYFLGAKGFCTYACPYGGVFGVADRLSPGRIRVTDACVQCGHCTATCTSNVDVSREVHDYGMVVDAGCMKCMDCVSVCPEGALYFGLGKPALLAKPRQERRKPAKRLPLVEEATALLAFAFAYFAYRGYRQEKDFLLSLGLAGCFAYLAVLTVRLARRKDVRVPGRALKAEGKVRPLGWLVAAGVLAGTAWGVPNGIVPAAAGIRAHLAMLDLRDVFARVEATGSALDQLSPDERATARVLLDSALVVHERSQPLTQVNTDRVIWGAMLTGDPAPMQRVLLGLLDDPRASVGFRSEAAGALLRSGLVEDAEAACRRILADEPAHGPTVATLADVLANTGRMAEADALVAKALELRPDDGALLFTRATLASARGDLGRAIGDLRRVLELDPNNGHARDRLWRMLADSRRGDEAVQVLREGLALDGAPEPWRAHLASVLLLFGKRDEAVAEARLLAAPDQDDPRLLEVAAEVLRQAGEAEEAAAIAARAAAR